MGVVLVILFIMFSMFMIYLDRWWGLLISILRGNSSYLKYDILESGICKEKQKEWAPKPKPFKSVWNMTPEEKEIRRLEIAEQRKKQQEIWNQTTQILRPAITHYTPPHKVYNRNELDDLADELFAELDN
jgi:hypothetical protein